MHTGKYVSICLEPRGLLTIPVPEAALMTDNKLKCLVIQIVPDHQNGSIEECLDALWSIVNTPLWWRHFKTLCYKPPIVTSILKVAILEDYCQSTTAAANIANDTTTTAVKSPSGCL